VLCDVGSVFAASDLDGLAAADPAAFRVVVVRVVVRVVVDFALLVAMVVPVFSAMPQPNRFLVRFPQFIADLPVIRKSYLYLVLASFTTKVVSGKKGADPVRSAPK